MGRRKKPPHFTCSKKLWGWEEEERESGGAGLSSVMQTNVAPTPGPVLQELQEDSVKGISRKLFPGNLYFRDEFSRWQGNCLVEFRSHLLFNAL